MTKSTESDADRQHWPKPLIGAFVAINPPRIIGVDGQIPWHYGDDLKRFKVNTSGTVIVMGRLTWESIGSKPLPNRTNIVISRNHVNGAECYTSVDEALDQYAPEDVWVIGGGQIYRAAFDRLNFLDVTYIPDTVEAENVVTFPEIDPDLWQQCSQHSFGEHHVLQNRQYLRRTI